MNFITDLSFNKCKNIVHDFILVMINYYIKITKYVLTRKTFNTIKLTKLFFEKITLKYNILQNIVSD